jgi:hypothetical protein
MTRPAIKENPPLRSERLLEALASGKLSGDVVNSLFLASQNWLANGGRVSMERYLRLPTTGPQLTRATRNLWLRRAAALIPIEGKFLKAGALHRQLNDFVTRGAWQSWKELPQPPEGASELRRALFFVAKFSGENVPSETTIWRALP